jgi:hypothetical protein
MIYLPVMNYNLPGSFGPDAEFHPRLADGRSNGKFIGGRIVVIGIFAIVPAVPILRRIANPFITVVEFMIPVAVSRSMSVTIVFVKMFLRPVDFGFVVNRLAIGTACVTLRLDALFGPIIALPVFPALGPRSTRE